ncbi:glyoxalase-like domain-containing protein [Pseudomassariella vexata]|uniref:Glyoxalase-like domain-domain-containing protein n=1 Tax=Pseudomassariella vexata TaxID=1141098 RepID=A0A1Y2E9S6_9PEZI|nr:glyoxalase-like domain-containing protein [Pseudomassariella vexata]ORY68321.1 glyoxalase-like domain-domain-containing protein [Pseudomassariella vexata]
MGDTPLLDHIVVLVPHSFLTTPPSWFANLFTFYPGGRHAEGLTENTLVLFADGSYIEFIAFVPGIDPAKRATHRWGRKKEGTVIDWAFTLRKNDAFPNIQRKVEHTSTGIKYSDLIPGGRIRPDGEVLQWKISSALKRDNDGQENGSIEPGQLPFWCLDVTPRELRVPYKDQVFTKHHSGAVGTAIIHIRPREASGTQGLEGVYEALLEKGKTSSTWTVDTLAGDGLHYGAQVLLDSKGVADGPETSISFFTDSSEFVGRTIGGEVNDLKLEFGFVASKG